MAWLRPPLLAPLQEGRRLMDTVGWAAILPQMLASLGAVFALPASARSVGTLVSDLIPLDSRARRGRRLLPRHGAVHDDHGQRLRGLPGDDRRRSACRSWSSSFGGDPAIVGAIGMLSGFCGTLMTPMAANFNVVPAALLELPRPLTA